MRLKTCPALDQVSRTSTYLASLDNTIILDLSGDVKNNTEIGTVIGLSGGGTDELELNSREETGGEVEIENLLSIRPGHHQHISGLTRYQTNHLRSVWRCQEKY